jgi:hypothetical protein
MYCRSREPKAFHVISSKTKRRGILHQQLVLPLEFYIQKLSPKKNRKPARVDEKKKRLSDGEIPESRPSLSLLG